MQPGYEQAYKMVKSVVLIPSFPPFPHISTHKHLQRRRPQEERILKSVDFIYRFFLYTQHHPRQSVSRFQVLPCSNQLTNAKSHRNPKGNEKKKTNGLKLTNRSPTSTTTSPLNHHPLPLISPKYLPKTALQPAALETISNIKSTSTPSTSQKAIASAMAAR